MDLGKTNGLFCTECGIQWITLVIPVPHLYTLSLLIFSLLSFNQTFRCLQKSSHFLLFAPPFRISVPIHVWSTQIPDASAIQRLHFESKCIKFKHFRFDVYDIRLKVHTFLLWSFLIYFLTLGIMRLMDVMNSNTILKIRYHCEPQKLFLTDSYENILTQL